MLELGKEVQGLAQTPNAERIQAFKRIIPCSTIRAILKKTGQSATCPRLPKWFMVWFVIGLGLFATDNYRQIFRWLQPLKQRVPGRSTLCEGRQRVGVAPIRYLAEKVVKLLATAITPGAFYQGMRLMALDGFVLDLFDSLANERVFGRPQGGRTAGAFPQARVLTLCEIGTHVMWKSLIKPIRCSEIAMAKVLLRWLQPDMLLLWDRGFLSYNNVQDARRQGPTGTHQEEPPRKEKVLGDGSYVTKLYRSSAPASRSGRHPRASSVPHRRSSTAGEQVIAC